MSEKNIEIASIHKGKVGLLAKGEQRTVHFEDKGEVGVAMVDEHEAKELLTIGLPHYWKPTVNADAGKKKDEDPEVKLLKTAEVIANIAAATTIEEVDAAVGDDKRVSVLAAAKDRRAELTDCLQRK